MPIYYTKNLAIDDYTEIRFVVYADSWKEAIILFKANRIANWKHYSMKDFTQESVKVLEKHQVIEWYYSE